MNKGVVGVSFVPKNSPQSACCSLARKGFSAYRVLGFGELLGLRLCRGEAVTTLAFLGFRV